MYHKPLSKINLLILSIPLMFTAYTKAQSQPLLGFENKAVEQAFNDDSRSVAKGIFLEFELNHFPNEEEKRIIADITEQAGLKKSEVMQLHDATIWVFDWPYWRFNEEGLAVCEQFKHLSQHCNSNTRILVWSN